MLLTFDLPFYLPLSENSAELLMIKLLKSVGSIPSKREPVDCHGNIFGLSWSRRNQPCCHVACWFLRIEMDKINFGKSTREWHESVTWRQVVLFPRNPNVNLSQVDAMFWSIPEIMEALETVCLEHLCSHVSLENMDCSNYWSLQFCCREKRWWVVQSEESLFAVGDFGCRISFEFCREGESLRPFVMGCVKICDVWYKLSRWCFWPSDLWYKLHWVKMKSQVFQHQVLVTPGSP